MQKTQKTRPRSGRACFRLRSGSVNFGHFLFEKQIVEGAERAVFLHLIDGHFASVDSQLNEAAPAVILMRADFSYILRIAIRTSEHTIHPVS
jgi:hypothetical protein